MNYFKDLLRLIFGMGDESPISDLNAYIYLFIFIGVLTLVVLITSEII